MNPAVYRSLLRWPGAFQRGLCPDVWAVCCGRQPLSVLYGLVPVGIPIPVFLLGLFTSGIQALVFATLAAAYVGEAMEVLG